LRPVVEDIDRSDKNAIEPVQSFRDAMLALVECAPDKRPSAVTSHDASIAFDALVGKYVGLLPILEVPSNAPFCQTALLGAQALQAGRTGVAAQIFEDVNFGTSNVTALTYVIQGVSLFLAVAVLLFMLSLLFVLVVSIRPDVSPPTLEITPIADSLSSPLGKVLVGTLFGCLGGVVSLLMRLPDFEVLKDKSRTFLRALGGTQPIIGGIFAFVLGAFISARIINISVGGSSEVTAWLFVVLGFLAGFSERFTRNLLYIAEGHFGGATGHSPQAPR
jgi:hypothetical protein